MTVRGFLRRHRTAVASNTALAVAAAAVVVYAVSADGYQEHRTALNDGGIWVTKSDRGYFGRVNKPIGRIDGAFFYEDDSELDVVQDGAAVVGLNVRAGRVLGLDPELVGTTDGAAASLADDAAVRMAGGTLAAADRAGGAVWATRYDPDTGNPLVGALDQQGKPLAKAGKDASLAVTTSGTVLVASAAEGELTTWRTDGLQLAEPETTDLPAAAGSPDALTAVGEVPVTLEAAAGRIAVVGGGDATLPPDGVLQQAGQAAGSVLVAHPGGLSEVDLQSGESTTVVEGVSGRPAEPVRLGACVYGAWSGGTGYVATRCGDGEPDVARLKGDATDLVFRVNRGQILLNDRDSGTSWDLDAENPHKIDNWEAFTDPKKTREKDSQEEQQSQGDRRPPTAEPDSFGARPGRTSVLHPLDNDSAPKGRLLAIRGVDKPSMPGAKVAISPDGQTLQLSLPEGARGSTSFRYYIDDGRSLDADAEVTVQVRGQQANDAPKVREGFEPKPWRVPAGGSIEVPVLPDWRDPGDSDPLLLESAQVVSQVDEGALARATTSGRVRFTAPDRGGALRVEYAVSDGLSEPVTQSLQFVVQDRADQTTYPASAEPDVISGEVGKPIIVRPLANDLPGSDPSTPDAQLALGGQIPDQAGVRVRTDAVAGTVRVDAAKAGTYLFDYDAAYGNASLDRGKIRVDVRPKPDRAREPVAMPDTLTLYGQSPATVDVLANDVDPAGGILVVQTAEPALADQLDVAIVDGRWLRVSTRQGDLTPRQQVVRYTISNGGSASVTGQVVVNQRPAPPDNAPVTAPDRATVRAGAVLVHPVLDNDFSPSGDRLELVGDPDPERPGRLDVQAPVDVKGDAGAAFASGRAVRYVAPRELAERESFTIPYIARNSTGETAEGRLTVVVVPDKGPNTAPQPPTLEGRLVAGDSVKLQLPGSGVDPDGDPVAITGIATAPALGRVVGFGANSLEFQAYPGSVGTEEFSYSVTDTRGAEATGTVRVAVVPPTPPQPPVAVPDVLTVAPGATGRVDVLANDFIGPADRVVVELVDPPAGVSLESELGPVRIEAPDRVDAERVQVVYSLTNGIDTSLGTATLLTEEGYNNAPVVDDAFGRADDSDAVTVDLLEGDAERTAAFDPDGKDSDLTVAEVYADPAAYRLAGSKVTVQRSRDPQVVPFRVEDPDGGTAMGSLYVPATGDGRPYVRDGALIELDEGGRVRGDLSDYVVNPSGGSLTIAGQQRAWSSPPTQVGVRPLTDTTFEVSARGRFRGPGAVLLEVVAEGTDQDGEPVTGEPTIVSIPVQVGSDQPTLTCPDTPIRVAQSESIEIDVASVCFVWTLDPADRFTLDYAAEWDQPVDGLEVAGIDGPVVRVSAAGATRAGSQAALSVRAGGSEPEVLPIQVERAPSPSLLPVTVPDMKPGDRREIDLASRMRAGISDPEPTILSVQQISGSSVRASTSGSTLVLQALPGGEGSTEFRIEMSDVSGDAGPERRVSGRVSVDVLDAPTVPGAPVDVGHKDRSIRLSWRPSQARGAPIDHYEVREVNSGRTQRFRTNGGEFRVRNGVASSFVVRAHNKVGYSAWSERSRSAVADTQPSRVPWIRMVEAGDHVLNIRWGEPASQTSAIQRYLVTWAGGDEVVLGPERSLLVPGLDNNRTYTFSIRAQNKAGTSDPRTSDPFQSVGRPATPTGLAVTDQQIGRDTTTVLVQWNGTLPEGPGPTTYTVYARGADGQARSVPGCARIEATSCRHTDVRYDGTKWDYTVQAFNQPGNSSPVSIPVSFQAVGKPDPWGAWDASATGQNLQVQLGYTVPVSRGAQSNVSVLVNGAEVARYARATGARSEVVNVPSNDGPHSVQLRVCNEFADRGGCSVSEAKQVQSYGPLNGQLTSVTANVQGNAIQWVITGSNNGNPAVIEYRLDGGPVNTIRLTGVGAFSQTTELRTVGWRTTQGIQVWLGDNDPGGRGEDYRAAEAVSGSPPEPAVGIGRGAACQDGAENTPGCQNQGWPGGPDCTDADCGFVEISSSGFVSAHKCEVRKSFTGAVWDSWGLGPELGPFEGNFRQQTGIYNSNAWVRLSCWTLERDPSNRGEPLQQTVSGWFKWPETPEQ